MEDLESDIASYENEKIKWIQRLAYYEETGNLVAKSHAEAMINLCMNNIRECIWGLSHPEFDNLENNYPSQSEK